MDTGRAQSMPSDPTTIALQGARSQNPNTSGTKYLHGNGSLLFTAVDD